MIRVIEVYLISIFLILAFTSRARAGYAGSDLDGLISGSTISPYQTMGSTSVIVSASNSNYSTMTVTIDSMAVDASITICSSATAATANGDLFIQFNGDIGTHYGLSRTTGATNGALAVVTTSANAVGLPIFGTSTSSGETCVELKILKNQQGPPKSGTFQGTAFSTTGVSGINFSYGAWIYDNPQSPITSISASIINAEGRNPINSGKHKATSYIRVRSHKN